VNLITVEFRGFTTSNTTQPPPRPENFITVSGIAVTIFCARGLTSKQQLQDVIGSSLTKQCTIDELKATADYHPPLFMQCLEVFTILASSKTSTQESRKQEVEIADVTTLTGLLFPNARDR
jgi:hypothetical protein